jgi:O-antigen/teichoic acid export membrane protein
MNLTKFGKNAFLYAAGTILLRTASFLLIPIYTFSLAVSDYGLLSVLLQTAQICLTVMGLGSRTALVRFAKEYEDKNELGTLLGTSILINLVGGAAVTAIMLLSAPLWQPILHTESVRPYLLLTCVSAFCNCLSIHLVSYYRAGEDGVKVTLANLGGAIALIAVSTIFLRVLHLGILGALLAQALIFGALTIFLFVLITSKLRIGVSFRLAGDLIRFGLPLILVSTGGLITQASALYFLSYFRGLDGVGIFSLGSKIAQVAEMALILPFVMAYEPFVYSHIGDSQLWDTISRLLTYLMIAFVFVATGIAFVAHDVVRLIAPPAYGSAYFVILLVLPAIAFRGVYYVGESLLFIEKKTHLAGGVVTTFTVLSIPLNYVAIWRLGMYGAVAVSVMTTVCTGAAVLKLGLGMSRVRIEKDRLVHAAVLLFGFLAAVYALHDANRYLYYIAVPAGACAGLGWLYFSGFIKQDERRVIHQLFERAARGLSLRNV